MCEQVGQSSRRVACPNSTSIAHNSMHFVRVAVVYTKRKSMPFQQLCSFFAGVFATLKAVPQKEGFLGLYKGNGAMMVRIFPYGAIQFMAFDNYKKV